MYLIDGQADLALTNFREELRVFQQLADHDPHDQNARENLVFAHNDVASASMRLKKFHEALTKVRHAIAIVTDLIAIDPKQSALKSDLGTQRSHLIMLAAQDVGFRLRKRALSMINWRRPMLAI